jgi:hypothetical protein
MCGNNYSTLASNFVDVTLASVSCYNQRQTLVTYVLCMFGTFPQQCPGARHFPYAGTNCGQAPVKGNIDGRPGGQHLCVLQAHYHIGSLHQGNHFKGVVPLRDFAPQNNTGHSSKHGCTCCCMTSRLGGLTRQGPCLPRHATATIAKGDTALASL